MKDGSLRILFVGDGSSIHTVRWLRFFLDRGHVVGLVSAAPPGHGLRLVDCFPLSPRASVPGTRLLRNVVETRRAIASFAPDILHAHYINEAGWLGAASGFHPLIITAWGSDIYRAPTESTLAAWLSPWAVRHADWVTADSLAQVQSLRAMGARPNRSSVVNWGVEMTDPDESRRGRASFRARFNVGPDDLVVLSPRQWIENSNIDVIVGAFALVRERFPRARLFLKRMNANPANYVSRIEAQIASLSLGDTVQILEEVPEVELPPMYEAADIMISVCTTDGTPVSLLEAMAGGCAVIVSDLPDLAEWVEDGINGFRVPAQDTAAVAQKMELLLSDARLRGTFAASGRRVAETRADRTQNLLLVEHTYRRLAARG